jgi:hypothetical protein
MATIVTRAAKGSPLTHVEVDANFTNLNTDKAETSSLSTVATTGAYADVTGTPAAALPLTGGTLSGGLTVTGTVAATSYTGSGAALTGIEGVPSGVIAIWSGSSASIPSGWLICDGANATPDLRDRFVIGAGSTYAVDATGGATTTASVAAHTHTLSGNTDASGTHTHTGTTSNTGAHSHNIPLNSGGGGYTEYGIQFVITSNVFAYGTSNTGAHSHTFTTAAGGDHTHTLSGNAASTGDASVSILNPYYALCYIMKT